MNDRQNRRHLMFIRVREFMAQHIGDFSPLGMARKLFDQLKARIGDLDGHATAQASGLGEAHQQTQTRGDARLALRQGLEAINRAARIMGLGERFPLPPQENDRKLIQSARAFAQDALPLKAEFIAHEMPEDFIEDLTERIGDLETSIAEQGSAVDDHISAAVAIDDTIDDGFEIVRQLDGLVRNKYADNPAVLAEWIAASHTERAPKRTQPPATPANPPAPPAR